jgi:hypothetical protein
MKICNTVLCAFYLLSLLSCGGAQQMITKETSLPNPPDWLNKPPKRSGFVYVVGVTSDAKTLAGGKEAAHQNAAKQISSLIGIDITSRDESKMDTEGTNFASAQLAARTAALVKNLEMQNEYYEKTTKVIGSYYKESYTVWVLARFALKYADEERKRQAAQQAELVYDSFKRFEDAKREIGAQNRREALILLAKAVQQLKSVPLLTELRKGGYDTASDLLRNAEKKLRQIDEEARGVQMKLEPRDSLGQKLKANLANHLAQNFAELKLRLVESGKARFSLRLSYETHVSTTIVGGGNRVKLGKLSYAATVKDTWSGAALPATSGDTKGFAKTKLGALDTAAFEASQAIVKTLNEHITKVMQEELSGS